MCNHGDTLRERRTSVSDEERRKEKIQFLPPRGSCCRRSFLKVFYGTKLHVDSDSES